MSLQVMRIKGITSVLPLAELFGTVDAEAVVSRYWSDIRSACLEGRVQGMCWLLSDEWPGLRVAVRGAKKEAMANAKNRREKRDRKSKVSSLTLTCAKMNCDSIKLTFTGLSQGSTCQSSTCKSCVCCSWRDHWRNSGGGDAFEFGLELVWVDFWSHFDFSRDDTITSLIFDTPVGWVEFKFSVLRAVEFWIGFDCIEKVPC